MIMTVASAQGREVHYTALVTDMEMAVAAQGREVHYTAGA